MGVLQKIRGLYRFDGDTEPVQVSRRQFFFASGVVLAGAALPVAAAPVVDNELFREWRFGDWRVGGPYGMNSAIYPKLVITGVDHASKTVAIEMARNAQEWSALRAKKFEYCRPGRTQ